MNVLTALVTAIILFSVFMLGSWYDHNKVEKCQKTMWTCKPTMIISILASAIVGILIGTVLGPVLDPVILQVVSLIPAPVWIALAVFGHFVLGAFTYRVVTHFDRPAPSQNENALFAFSVFCGYIAFATSAAVGIVYIILKAIGAFVGFLKAVGGLK